MVFVVTTTTAPTAAIIITPRVTAVIEVNDTTEERIGVRVTDVALLFAVDSDPQILHKNTTIGFNTSQSARSCSHCPKKCVKSNVHVG